MIDTSEILKIKLEIAYRYLICIMKNKGKKIANEVWNMLPDDCKEIMKSIEKEFKKSIEADVNDLFVVKSNKKCECKISTFTRDVDADYNPLCGKCWLPI